MSENINDTDVFIIKAEANQMIEQMVEERKNNDVNTKKEILQEKYSNLFKTSKTLFNTIYNESSDSNFDKVKFRFRLNKMLELVYKIQNSNITQETASEEIGTILAKEYIPQLKENE